MAKKYNLYNLVKHHSFHERLSDDSSLFAQYTAIYSPDRDQASPLRSMIFMLMCAAQQVLRGEREPGYSETAIRLHDIRLALLHADSSAILQGYFCCSEEEICVKEEHTPSVAVVKEVKRGPKGLL